MQRGVRRLLLAVMALVLIAAGAAVGGVGTVIALGGLFIVLTPLERIFRRHDQRVLRRGFVIDLGYAFMNSLLSLAVIAPVVVIAAVAFVASGPAQVGLAAVRLVVQAQPVWLQVIELFLTVELLGYWVHRLFHEVPFLWRFHAVHHSSPRLDWLAGFRAHPLEAVIGVGAVIPVVLLGFAPQTVGAVFLAVQAISGLFAHANVRWRLRPLHKIVLTPEFHHWHHAYEPGAINTNYAGTLPVLDIIFGTYHMPRDRRPQVYGTDDSVEAYDMREQLAYPFRRRRRVTRSVWGQVGPTPQPASLGS